MKILFHFIIACFSTLLFVDVSAQVTKLRGTVIDAATQEPLPFVNVVFTHTTKGTVSDLNGTFFLETNLPIDSAQFSLLGYQDTVIAIKNYMYQEVNIYLQPDITAIDEVVVRPGANPAIPILENIIAHKYQHNPTSYNSIQYEVYNKSQVDINNFGTQQQGKAAFKKFDFVFDYVDTSAVTGKTYLPALISESVTEYYYQKSPRKEGEIIKASRISGIDNESVSQFTGRLYQQVNIYENFITIFDPEFVSPIADFAQLYYKYYLLDSALIDGHWCYYIVFKPKRKQENTFSGNFWVADTSFAITRMELRMSPRANINFLNDAYLNLEFQSFNDSLWYLSRDELFVDVNVRDKATGINAKRTSFYRNVVLNKGLSDEILAIKNNTLLLEDATEKDNSYWDTVRTEELTEKEKGIYEMVDSVQQVPLYKVIERIGLMLTDYYIVMGNFEYGPYFSTYSNNEIEGNRLRVGGRTSNKFSTKIMPEAYVAYGFKDERIKYGTSVQYMFNKDPRRELFISFKHDIQQLGTSEDAYREDNILNTIFRRNPFYKLTMVDEAKAYYMHEWFLGFSNTLEVSIRDIYSTPYIPFIDANTTAEINKIRSSEITLRTHYGWREKFLLGEFERISLGSERPIFDLSMSFSPKGFIGSEYQYFKLDFAMSDKLEISPFGYFNYKLQAGQVFGNVAYPLLKLHEGNETYIYTFNGFNMMNYYEFASDQYASFIGEQHFQGFFLNKVPFLRRLQLREVFGGKVLYGSLNSKNQQLVSFPGDLYTVDGIYSECSVGIENILRLIRVDAMWRLTHLDNPNIQAFGVRMSFKVEF